MIHRFKRNQINNKNILITQTLKIK